MWGPTCRTATGSRRRMRVEVDPNLSAMHVMLVSRPAGLSLVRCGRASFRRREGDVEATPMRPDPQRELEQAAWAAAERTASDWVAGRYTPRSVKALAESAMPASVRTDT